MGPDALTELVERHAAALMLYARQWCGSPEDVVQAAFLKLARQAAVPDRLIPWLYRVVRNGAIDAGRAERRRQKYEAMAAADAPTWFVPPEDPAGLDAEAATAALAALPTETREIVVAHLWGGLTFEQVAVLVGGSASTCYRRYAAALETLRCRLDPTPTRRPTR